MSISPAAFFSFPRSTATAAMYPLSLHDALPIYIPGVERRARKGIDPAVGVARYSGSGSHRRIIKVRAEQDRKSTRLNSSHLGISYAVFCLKKKESDKRRRLRQFMKTVASEVVRI